MKLLGAAGLVFAALAGCSGDDGPAGSAGTQGVVTAPAADATALSVTITGVTVSSPPVVNFRVTNQKGESVTGLTADDVRFTMAKLVPGSYGSPASWQSYINTRATGATGTPGAGTTAIQATREGGLTGSFAGTLTANSDGSYTYAFKTDVTNVTSPLAVAFEPNLTHRVGIQTRGTLPLANAVYTFRPADGATSGIYLRDIVKTEKCNECHSTLQAHDQRIETKYCVTCHNPGSSDPDSGNTVDFKVMIHKIHRGEFLPSVEAGGKYQIIGFGGAVHDYGEVAFPQDIRNCSKCHDGADPATPQGDNWKAQPSREACGSCHDNVNFATGAGHAGGAKDNSTCVGCHSSGGMVGPVANSHIPVTPINETVLSTNVATGNTNAASLAANHSNLPAGAIKVTYDVKSVSRDANKNPQIVFRILQDGARKDFNVYSAGVVTELWDNFVGSPSVYFVFAVPQDGIAAPADYNVSVSSLVKSLWNGSAAALTTTAKGTLSGPDSSGYYTATLTGTVVPDNAVMLTGGLGFTYSLPASQPLTQTNVTGYAYNATTKIGGLIVVAPTAQMVATGYTARRQIVDSSLCNKCHNTLGTFANSHFHAGQRNNANTCAFCHRPNQTSSGWSADSTSYVHAIHASAKREKPFTWHAASTTHSYDDIAFPGILKRCETCHLPGMYDFRASTSASAVPNRLYRTVGQGIYNGTVGATITTYSYSSTSGTCVAGTSSAQTDVGVFSLSPYITPLANYGIGFSYNTGLTTARSCKPDGTLVANPAGGTVAADSTTLVNSPIATVCFACHDGDLPRAHMETYGASIYQPRGTALATVEQCLVCHGPGTIAAIAEMHAK